MFRSQLIVSYLSFFVLISCGNQETVDESPKENPIEKSPIETDELIEKVDTNNYEDQWMEDRLAKIQQFANAVLNDDIQKVSTYINYPFNRDAPIPAILNQEEFENYYPTLFDATLKEKLTTHLESPDIIDLSMSNGTIGILNGLIWFNDPCNKIVSINYQSEGEMEKMTRLDLELRNAIHPILKEFDQNIFLGRTEDGLFRIDETTKGLRYASWSGKQTLADEPDFILWDGVKEKQGSAGGWTTTFDNVDTKYILDEVFMCENPADCGTFLVVEDEGEITSKLMVTEVLNPFTELAPSQNLDDF